jgi:hypothetical protein
MRRFTLAALLAGLGFLSPNTASANDGPCSFGYGCWGCTLRMFPKIHQHGPLFNYGPYYGYPPFEPYGNWNSYLQYTGPTEVPGGHGWHAAPGAGAYGWIHGPNPHTFGHGNPHPLRGGNGGGLFHRGHGKSGECSTCGSVAEQVVTSGKAFDRFTGVGTPAHSQAYYADSPQLITVGYSGR